MSFLWGLLDWVLTAFAELNLKIWQMLAWHQLAFAHSGRVGPKEIKKEKDLWLGFGMFDFEKDSLLGIRYETLLSKGPAHAAAWHPGSNPTDVNIGKTKGSAVTFKRRSKRMTATRMSIIALALKSCVSKMLKRHDHEFTRSRILSKLLIKEGLEEACQDFKLITWNLASTRVLPVCMWWQKMIWCLSACDSHLLSLSLAAIAWSMALA